MAENLIPVTGLTSVAVSTASAWQATNIAVPNGVYMYESDTGKAKIADGSTLYASLPYHTENVLTDTFKNLLDKAGQPNGVAVLDTNGFVPSSNLPVNISNSPVIVQTISDRDAIPVADRTNIVVVTDASADPNATLNTASYFWNTNTTAWVKISEADTLSLDFSQFLESGDAIDLLADSSNFVKMTPAERTKLTNAMLKTEQYQIVSLGAAAFTN